MKWALLLVLLLAGCASAPAPTPSTEIQRHADALADGLVRLRVAVRPFTLSAIESCQLLGRDSDPCLETSALAGRLVIALELADVAVRDYRAKRITLPSLFDAAEDAIALAARYAEASLAAFRAVTNR